MLFCGEKVGFCPCGEIRRFLADFVKYAYAHMRKLKFFEDFCVPKVYKVWQKHLTFREVVIKS